MAVAFDNAISAKNVTNNTALSSGNLAVGSLTNAAGVAIIAWLNTTGTARTVSTVKLDSSGASFTRRGGTTKVNVDGTDVGIDWWDVVGASLTNANHTADVVMSGNTLVKMILFFTAQGVDQTTPSSGLVSDNTDTTSPSALSPTGGTASDLGAVGTFVIDGGGAGTMAASTNTTQRGTTQNDAGVEGDMFAGGTGAGNAASLGMTWSTAAVGTLSVSSILKAVAAAASEGSHLLMQGVS